MLRYINRKTLSCRESNRSTNFIAPDLITGCGFKCSYCVEKGTLISTPNGQILVEEHIIFDEYPSFFKDGTFVKNQSFTKVVNDQSVLRHKVDIKLLTKPFNLYTHEERKDFIFN